MKTVTVAAFCTDTYSCLAAEMLCTGCIVIHFMKLHNMKFDITRSISTTMISL